ncbi:hypothetical protein [Candidatus Amarolinea dominans]|uniref:hypothetical protein n=1 Tax=Candidatus Amarolinea dominans TaxID=3140696 RepID=UPI001DCFB746|nr:hypothetical protein [Anaerolineae bacterium]
MISLRDLSLQIAQTTDLGAVNAAVREAATLTKRILDGQDINGNESVDPIPNEGGVITAYLHAQFMADIILAANPGGQSGHVHVALPGAAAGRG